MLPDATRKLNRYCVPNLTILIHHLPTHNPFIRKSLNPLVLLNTQWAQFFRMPQKRCWHIRQSEESRRRLIPGQPSQESCPPTTTQKRPPHRRFRHSGLEHSPILPWPNKRQKRHHPTPKRHKIMPISHPRQSLTQSHNPWHCRHGWHHPTFPLRHNHQPFSNLRHPVQTRIVKPKTHPIPRPFKPPQNLLQRPTPLLRFTQSREAHPPLLMRTVNERRTQQPPHVLDQNHPRAQIQSQLHKVQKHIPPVVVQPLPFPRRRKCLARRPPDHRVQFTHPNTQLLTKSKRRKLPDIPVKQPQPRTVSANRRACLFVNLAYAHALPTSPL